jgi:hypothetical protein
LSEKFLPRKKTLMHLKLSDCLISCKKLVGRRKKEKIRLWNSQVTVYLKDTLKRGQQWEETREKNLF